ncbi:MAG TPA: capsule assembly Wzi family protein, partial [Ferruginibacter sp.]|nr:capsule assembly Wzi family protein [Ferruginibacter sp.]
GNSYLFLKLNTKIWKFNYQNLFMELMPQFKKVGDTLLDRKYAAMHHLSMNVTKWLNIGVFEGVIFGRKNRFDFQYLNPIIFYRSVEGNVGSPDNALVGLDFKANVAHRAQVYGQFLLDEFILSKIKNDPTNWVNKWGVQLGVKYVDAFNIRNLDLQFETNRVRPFTYSHGDTIANYTNYNQPLAHPLGANFQEFLGILNYQPKPKWYINARAIYYYQGLDSAGKNFGGNIFENYTTRTMESGFSIGSGKKAKCLNALLTVSYEWKENLYFDVSAQYRTYKFDGSSTSTNTTFVNAGIRLNMFKRGYDF